MSSNQVVECQYHVVEKKVEVVENKINPKNHVVENQSKSSKQNIFDRDLWLSPFRHILWGMPVFRPSALLGDGSDAVESMLIANIHESM